MEQIGPLAIFKARAYDILAHREKLLPIAPIGVLTGPDSAVCVALGLAADKLLEDAALELAEASFDGIALTLISIYEHGLPAKMRNENMQKLAEILAKAGDDARTASDQDAKDPSPDTRPDDVGTTGTLQH